MLSLKGNPIAEADARWIRQRIGALLSFYFVAGDSDIARVQAHQFVKILGDYTRDEIDAAATHYAATVEDRAPNPAKIVALIEAAREKSALRQAERDKWAREKRQHDDEMARRQQRITPERANEITKEFNIHIKRFGGKPRVASR